METEIFVFMADFFSEIEINKGRSLYKAEKGYSKEDYGDCGINPGGSEFIRPGRGSRQEKDDKSSRKEKKNLKERHISAPFFRKEHPFINHFCLLYIFCPEKHPGDHHKKECEEPSCQ